MSRATKAHCIGYMMYWQISVTIMPIGDQWGGERNGSETCVRYFMTHNDLCTCIALTKWDGPVACGNVTENVVNFIILPQPKPLWQYQWSNMNMTVTRCTFSVDFKEIKTISQPLPSTCAICLQPRQNGRHRGGIETLRLSGTVNFQVRI